MPMRSAFKEDKTCVPSIHQFQVDDEEIARPLPNEYPVWYFITGELSRSEVLMKLLKLDKQPDLRPASVKGLVQVHERQCNALVIPSDEQNRQGRDSCTGWAYGVKNAKEERLLLYFKTGYFTAMHCTMTLSSAGTFGYPSDAQGFAFVYKYGEAAFRNTNMMPIASVEGGVGSLRAHQESHIIAPFHVPSKARSTTSVEELNALGNLTTSTTGQDSASYVSSIGTLIGPPLQLTNSQAASARQVAAHEMWSQRPNFIPRPGAKMPIPKDVPAARAVSKGKEKAKAPGPLDGLKSTNMRAAIRKNRVEAFSDLGGADDDDPILFPGRGLDAADSTAVFDDDPDEDGLIMFPDYGAATPGPSHSGSSSRSGNVSSTRRAQVAANKAAMQISLDGVISYLNTQRREDEQLFPPHIMHCIPQTPAQFAAWGRGQMNKNEGRIHRRRRRSWHSGDYWGYTTLLRREYPKEDLTILERLEIVIGVVNQGKHE